MIFLRRLFKGLFALVTFLLLAIVLLATFILTNEQKALNLALKSFLPDQHNLTWQSLELDLKANWSKLQLTLDLDSKGFCYQTENIKLCFEKVDIFGHLGHPQKVSFDHIRL